MAEIPDLVWRRSRRCANNACVEVAYDERFVYVRSSEGRDEGHLRFEPEAWRAFIEWVCHDQNLP
jgi:hypothetical protein